MSYLSTKRTQKTSLGMYLLSIASGKLLTYIGFELGTTTTFGFDWGTTTISGTCDDFCV